MTLLCKVSIISNKSYGMDTVGLYGMAGTALLLGIAIIAWAIKLAVPHKELTRLYAQAEGIE